MRVLERWNEELLIVLRLPLALLGCAALLVLGARLWWIAELATHFCWQLLLVSLVCTLATLPLWRAREDGGRLYVGAAALLTLIFAVPVGRAYAPVVAGAQTPEAAALRVLHFNVHTSNQQKARAVEHIAAADPDLVVVQEVDPAWLAALEAGLPEHRVLAASPRQDNFGIAVFAHARVVEARAEVEEDAWSMGVPIIEVELGELRLLAVHTLPPISTLYARRRDAMIVGIAQWSSAHAERPRVVVGDLNLSIFSPRFRDLEADGALIDGRRSAGVFARRTFPSGPLGLLLGIPIDHVLHSEVLTALSFEVADDWGSDHRAVITNLVMATED